MRLREIVRYTGELRYREEHKGPNRKKVRKAAAKIRREAKGKGSARAKPKNWNRDKPKRRKERTHRRKQSWKR